MFIEIVNETLLENMTKDMYAIPQCEEDMLPSTKNTYLTKYEENVIRYACGYVGMKLHNRFVKQPGEVKTLLHAFVECERIKRFPLYKRHNVQPVTLVEPILIFWAAMCCNLTRLAVHAHST